MDTNPCSRTQPCRTFPTAIAQTQAGGDVIALDAAGYGPITGANAITKSITLVTPDGGYAGIMVVTGDGITVNAGVNDVVILRGLVLNGTGGTNGIVFNSGGSLHVEKCILNGFSTSGITHKSTGDLYVQDTTFRNNKAPSGTPPAAVLVGSNPGGVSFASLDHCQILRNGVGVSAVSGARVTVSDSTLNGNDTGVQAKTVGGDALTADVSVAHSILSKNGTGVVSDGAKSTVRVLNSVVNYSTTGLSHPNAGQLLTDYKNVLELNVTPGDFSDYITSK